MLKEIHKIYDIRTIKKIEFTIDFNDVILAFLERKHNKPFHKKELNKFIELFKTTYPTIKNFGWYYLNDISIIFQSYNKDNENEIFIPLEFDILDEQSKSLIKNKNNNFIKDNYGDNQSHYKGFEKLFKIASGLKNLEIYNFLRVTNHQILSIDPNILKIFEVITDKPNSAFYMKRFGKYVMFYDQYNPVFCLKI